MLSTQLLCRLTFQPLFLFSSLLPSLHLLVTSSYPGTVTTTASPSTNLYILTSSSAQNSLSASALLSFQPLLFMAKKKLILAPVLAPHLQSMGKRHGHRRAMRSFSQQGRIRRQEPHLLKPRSLLYIFKRDLLFRVMYD